MAGFAKMRRGVGQAGAGKRPPAGPERQGRSQGDFARLGRVWGGVWRVAGWAFAVMRCLTQGSGRSCLLSLSKQGNLQAGGEGEEVEGWTSSAQHRRSEALICECRHGQHHTAGEFKYPLLPMGPRCLQRRRLLHASIVSSVRLALRFKDFLTAPI